MASSSLDAGSYSAELVQKLENKLGSRSTRRRKLRVLAPRLKCQS